MSNVFGVVKVLLIVLDASDKMAICDASFVLGGIGLSDVLHGVSGGQGLGHYQVHFGWLDCVT